jgi:hypothetical protein
MKSFIDFLRTIVRFLLIGKHLFFKKYPISHRIGSLKHYLSPCLFPERSDQEHLDAAIQWLCRAQDACGGQGVSALYDLKKGWQAAYPETSGYIIATFLAYADLMDDRVFIDRALRIGQWEIDIQTPSGGIFSSEIARNTRVFNTGQVLLGWCALYERTKGPHFLEAAVRAGIYLLHIQEPDGSWKKDTHCGHRTYHARVDWGLLRLAQLSGDQQFADAAIRNLKWVLSQQNDNGWFNLCGFNDNEPITHSIGYTMRGLLECHLTGDYCRELPLLPSIIKAADALCKAIQAYPVRGIKGIVPASFDRNWKGHQSDSCLTGNAQLAIILYRLSQTVNQDNYKAIADDVIRSTKRTQNLDIEFAPVRGAIPGSFPVWRGYISGAFPNWATKFYSDALMLKIGYNKNIKILA